MSRFLDELKDFWKKGDIFLLILCLIVSGFGCVFIASATSADKFGGNIKYIIIQLAATGLGVMMYALVSSIDLDFLSEHRMVMVAFNCALLLMLISPLGTDHGSGNRSWINLGFISVQPAEVCKITYIIILAKTMSLNRNRISSLRSVGTLTFHMLWIVALIVVISHDTGVALIFMFLFVVMAYVGGVSGWWFLGGAGAVAAVSPYLWKYFIRDDQKQRILALIDPSIDPDGLGVLWQTNKSLEALRNGGLTGQGLFHGDLTSIGYLPAQHTDSIFSSIGEQLGMLGCLAALLLLLAIVLRCIQVGMKSPDYMNRLICIGIASMLLFQILINVGVCLGLFPVVGLALPFLSYGGSSILTSFLAMGIVSGIKMRPAPDMSAHYIRPY